MNGHSTIRDGRKLIWENETLWLLAADLKPFEIAIEEIAELDCDCWFQGDPQPTLRVVAGHFKKMLAAEPSYPIILNDNGALMDGGHRICKALAEGKKTILAVQFPTMPTPDRSESVG